MSDDLRILLDDLARYLEQQRAAGSTFYLEGDALPDEAHDAPAPAPVESAVKPAEPPQTPKAQPPAAPAPAAPAPAPATAPARPAPKQDPDDAFAQQCDAFVRDTLALIARTRAHVPQSTKPDSEQSAMFVSPQPVAAAPAPPEAPADKAVALEAIAEEARACTSCLLHGSRRNAVPGAGNPDAGLVLIGEAPGAEEDRQGLPFVGPSGKLLGDILKAIGFARDDVFICNILKCRPPANRDPERAEVDACEPFLRRQLQVIRPRLVLCLGRVAAQTLLGTTAPLGSLRRSVHFYAGVPVMATFHPAALLRNPGHKRDTWDDVRKLRALYDTLGTLES